MFAFVCLPWILPWYCETDSDWFSLRLVCKTFATTYFMLERLIVQKYIPTSTPFTEHTYALRLQKQYPRISDPHYLSSFKKLRWLDVSYACAFFPFQSCALFTHLQYLHLELYTISGKQLQQLSEHLIVLKTLSFKNVCCKALYKNLLCFRDFRSLETIQFQKTDIRCYGPVPSSPLTLPAVNWISLTLENCTLPTMFKPILCQNVPMLRYLKSNCDLVDIPMMTSLVYLSLDVSSRTFPYNLHLLTQLQVLEFKLPQQYPFLFFLTDFISILLQLPTLNTLRGWSHKVNTYEEFPLTLQTTAEDLRPWFSKDLLF